MVATRSKTHIGASLTGVAITLLLVSGCSKARLMEAMSGTNEPNEKILGQMFAVGGAGEADRGADGVARIAVDYKPRETIFRPAIVMMDRPGELEIVFRNDNPQGHLMVVVPSDGGKVAIDLPPLHAGTARVRLGTPGMYVFADAMGNHMGRGMMGMIVVEGEVSSGAKLDRPVQPRP